MPKIDECGGKKKKVATNGRLCLDWCIEQLRNTQTDKKNILVSKVLKSK